MDTLVQIMQEALDAFGLGATDVHEMRIVAGPGAGEWFVDCDARPGFFVRVLHLHHIGLTSSIHKYKPYPISS